MEELSRDEHGLEGEKQNAMNKVRRAQANMRIAREQRKEIYK